jgi:hypothetical protein
VLNLMKQEKTVKLRAHAKQLKAGWHEEYRLKVIRDS